MVLSTFNNLVVLATQAQHALSGPGELGLGAWKSAVLAVLYLQLTVGLCSLNPGHVHAVRFREGS